jgi:hypothetical protein
MVDEAVALALKRLPSVITEEDDRNLHRRYVERIQPV